MKCSLCRSAARLCVMNVSYSLVKLSCFDLKLRDVCLIKPAEPNTPLHPVKQTPRLSARFTAPYNLFLLSSKHHVFIDIFFLFRNANFLRTAIPVFWFRAFLVWAELTGLLILWSPFLIFYLNSLFNISSPIKPPPATGYTVKTLSDLLVHIIPLCVYTAQTWNKLNYFWTKKGKCDFNTTAL